MTGGWTAQSFARETGPVTETRSTSLRTLGRLSQHRPHRAWHKHPLDQTLVVTSGTGWTQCEGEPIVEIRAGDVDGQLTLNTGP